MAQLLWQDIHNEEAITAPGPVSLAPGEDVTEKLHRVVEDGLGERRTGNKAKDAVKQMVIDE